MNEKLLDTNENLEAIEDLNREEILSKFKPKERNFLLALRKHGEQGKAAREAGYSEKSADVQASRLMQRKDIQEALKALYKLDCKALCINEDSLILMSKEIYDRCMQAKPVMKWDSETAEWVESGTWQFDSNGANKAVANIMKVAGLEKKELDLKAAKDFSLEVKVLNE